MQVGLNFAAGNVCAVLVEAALDSLVMPVAVNGVRDGIRKQMNATIQPNENKSALTGLL